MLKLKPGVKLGNLQPQIVLALIVADGIFREMVYNVIVTSANDSRHSSTSLHYSGNAVDLRTHHVGTMSEKLDIENQLKDALGSDFDVVLESVGTPNEHIHIEYQPRG